MNTIVRCINTLRHFIDRGHKRSVLAKKNIFASFALRGVDILLGFIALPLALRYLNAVQFGLFVTLTSIVEWFSYFDIGLNHGLRNKFAEAVAANDNNLARIYVSTSYCVLGAIISVVLCCFLIANLFLDWSVILNAPKSLQHELKVLSIIVFAAFSVKFVVSLVNAIFYALQKPAIIDMLNVIRKIIWIGAIFMLIFLSKGSLLHFGAANSIILAAVPLVAGIYYYNFRQPKYAPSLFHIELKYARELTTLGMKFFIIQVFSVVIIATNNVLIAQFAGPESVTSYNIAYRYFGFLVMFFTIIITPLWSAYTEAYRKDDMAWIRSTLRIMIRVWIMTIGIAVIMLIVSGPVIRVWIGGSIQIPFIVSGLVALLVLVNSWISVFHYFINSTSKIKLQMWLTIIAGVVNIPLSIFFVKCFKLGSAGVILGSIVCLLPSAVVAPIQTYKIIRKDDFGIWGV